ncbi:MAG TPA: MobF family relaxase [Acidimicrobiales bacterium]|jgi:conjugative relaxase-like TrwC/TraI family protein|nr:MobF family relaxase [Acidimicrobiales bacterium]
MRMMGAESVAYHRSTVLGRADDHPGQALAYYASRGETPMRWGGSGATALGLDGEVTPEAYEAVFGPGGARHPGTGGRLACTRRPGMELVISAHKSVAELGVIGRAEDMHQIMDAERDATLDYLDRVVGQVGGRRGRAGTPTATSGLAYAHTRHATSRAGDPCPHDHVLIANVIEMLDALGGWKAADTTLWREHLHAATMVGRVAAARQAMELGYGIEPDRGPSGKLRHWRVAGVPDEVCQVHSKRAAEIDAECKRRGQDSHRARGVAARATRAAKDHQGEGELLGRWRAELAAVDWPVERLAASIGQAAARRRPVPRLRLQDLRRLVATVTDGGGELARRKVFSRRQVIVELAPLLFGQRPAMVEAIADRVLADPDVIPLVGVTGARERVHALASTLATESAIAAGIDRQVTRQDGPAAPTETVEAAIADAEASLGGSLSAEQRSAALAIATSGRGGEIVVGVAGAGKTTMLAVVASAFESSGHRVVGTATSGQAARTLGAEARIGESRTLASLTWRLDHHRLALDERTVIILDEAGSTDDTSLLRLTAHVEAAGAKLVLVGDDHQLGPVGPGGALAALIGRHPDALHRLTQNRRQADPDERTALGELRDRDVSEALAWYRRAGRIHTEDRADAVQAAVDAWATDTAGGAAVGLYAWRRANVAELNVRARFWMADSGRLSGPELVCPGGTAYRAGDHVVALAPDLDRSLVTSQRAVVVAVDPAVGALTLRTTDGRQVRLAGEDAGADRLGYGYATTVHRAQGETVDRAHLFADGGGRELAYVAMSRARQTTHVWTVADDPDQACEDLRRDWGSRRTPVWVSDTGLPAASDTGPHLAEGDRARVVALIYAREALAGNAATQVASPPRCAELADAQAALDRARQDRTDLDTGTGVYVGTDAGRAVADMAQARQALSAARWTAAHGGSRRDRRDAAKQVSALQADGTDAGQRWEIDVKPEAARLDGQIERLESTAEQLSARDQRRSLAAQAVIEAGFEHQRHARQLARRLDTHRNHLDRLGAPNRATALHHPGPSTAPNLIHEHPEIEAGPDI